MNKKTVAVIGGGAAGMIAAGKAAENASKVYLIDKNKRLGKKLRITGKGRCNITNSAEIEDFFKCIPVNHKFLYSALYTFTNDDIIKLIESQGVKTKVERGGRVFPESDSAHDVAEALSRYACKKNVYRITGIVTDLEINDGCVSAVMIGERRIECDSVIICTGGKSYPLTGSTGDGYRFAEKCGHTIIEPKASLIPMITSEKWVSKLSGLSLKNVELSVFNKKNKKIFTDFGEMLFTHFGISGPLVLSASAHMKKPETEGYRVTIDLKPALSMEQLDMRIVRDFEKYSRKQLQNGLDDLLPKSLIDVIIELSQIDRYKQINTITREERRKLCEVLKAIPLNITGFRPVEEAIVTSGGIKVSEINPSTMESKLVKGLYFAGEVIDADAYTGGYNLQIAWSTGYLAGENAASNSEY